MWRFRSRSDDEIFNNSAIMHNQQMDIINKHQKELEEAERKLMELKIEQNRRKWLIGS